MADIKKPRLNDRIKQLALPDLINFFELHPDGGPIWLASSDVKLILAALKQLHTLPALAPPNHYLHNHAHCVTRLLRDIGMHVEAIERYTLPAVSEKCIQTSDKPEKPVQYSLKIEPLSAVDHSMWGDTIQRIRDQVASSLLTERDRDNAAKLAETKRAEALKWATVRAREQKRDLAFSDDVKPEHRETYDMRFNIGTRVRIMPRDDSDADIFYGTVFNYNGKFLEIHVDAFDGGGAYFIEAANPRVQRSHMPYRAADPNAKGPRPYHKASGPASRQERAEDHTHLNETSPHRDNGQYIGLNRTGGQS